MRDTGLLAIDADAHIIETEDTWRWVPENALSYRPTTELQQSKDPSRPPNRYWVIDGNRRPRGFQDDAATRTTVATRELLDPAARVRQMDALGTEVQVIYPSLFLVSVSDKPEIDLALKHSYNRWMAERCQQTAGRLRWVCQPPLADMQRTLEELKFAKANGACAVMKKGDREAGHWVNEEYFFPFYEACERLDLPVVFHIGAGELDKTSAREFLWIRFAKLGIPPLHAFYNLAMFGVPHRFPGVRWGFIEAGASWVPFLCYDIQRRLARQKGFTPGYVYENPSDVVTMNKFYITCQVDEDLPYIMDYATEDHLIAGSDYSHEDPAGEMDFVPLLRRRQEQGHLSQAALRKIVRDNAKRFYGV